MNVRENSDVININLTITKTSIRFNKISCYIPSVVGAQLVDGLGDVGTAKLDKKTVSYGKEDTRWVRYRVSYDSIMNPLRNTDDLQSQDGCYHVLKQSENLQDFVIFERSEPKLDSYWLYQRYTHFMQ